jgi:hypothetical protein
MGFLIVLPNIIWQYQNSFPLLFHMRELQETQLQYVDPKGFLIGQLMINLPCFFIWVTGFLYVLLSKQYRFAGLAYIFVITLLLIGHGKDYYAAGAYPVLFAFGAKAIESFTPVKRKWLRIICIAFPVAVGLLALPVALPVLPPQQLADLYVKLKIEKTGALKWEDLKNHPLPQDFSDMLGWEEMAQKAAKAYSMLSDAEKKESIIFCDNYGMAGALNYYARKYHLPESYSDNASFLYWLPSHVHFKNFVLVTDDHDEKEHDFAKDFQSITITDSVTSKFARERGDYIYLFKGADDNFQKYMKEKIAKDKAEFKY